MSRNAFVTEDRPWVFNRRADVKILRLRVVSRDEKEARWIFVVNAGRIHEATGAGRFERLRQLSNLKRAKVTWQRHKIMFLQEADHFCLAAFVRFQKRFLIRRD